MAIVAYPRGSVRTPVPMDLLVSVEMTSSSAPLRSEPAPSTAWTVRYQYLSAVELSRQTTEGPRR